LVNIDTNIAGISVTPSSGNTSQSGGIMTFNVVLDTKPTGNVIVPITSSDSNEGVPNVSSLTFTPANWNIPQQVIVKGVDDHIAQGNVPYTIDLGFTSSTDPNYNLLNPSVSLVNIGTDIAKITVTPTSGLVTNDNGGTAEFAVSISSQPLGNITIPVTVSDPTQGTTSTSLITFTPSNWTTPQIITVTGLNDHIANGNQVYNINLGPSVDTTPGDGAYNGVLLPSVAVENLNTNHVGVTVIPTSGLTTSQAGLSTTFNVVLTSAPTGNVIIPIASSDTSEGTTNVSSLVFTPANWNIAQTVTVTGVDDHIDQGNVPYMIDLGAVSSSDGSYNGFNPADVSITNLGTDHAAVILTAPVGGLVVTQSGTSDTFTVQLATMPSGNVTIPLATTDTTDTSLSVSSVTFTPANWNIPQTVTVTGLNDLVAQGNVPFRILTGADISTDPKYNGMSGPSAPGVVLQTNHPGVDITPTNLTVSATGPLQSFDVTLNSKPTNYVVIPFAVTDTTAALISQTSLVFGPDNWNIPQTIYVRGLDDHIATGNLPFVIIPEPAQSFDSVYNNMSGPLVNGLDLKPDTVGVDATPIVGTISDNGAQATFTVVLTSKPTGDVSVPLTMSNPALGTLSTSTAIFTPANWNTPQTITITGIDDHIIDGTQPYTVTLGNAASTDTTGYNGLGATPPVLTGISINTDVANFVSHINGSGFPDSIGSGGTIIPGILETNINHTMASFDIRLYTQPTSNVYITFADPSPGHVLNNIIMFTPQNWNVSQLVTVQGGSVGGNYNVLGTATSADANYNHITTQTYLAQNDAIAAHTNHPDAQGNLVTTNIGGMGSFDAVLSAKPTQNVFITFHTTSASAHVLNSIVEFTPYNWNTPQLISVQGTVNGAAANDIHYDILGVTKSLDLQYNGLTTDIKAVNHALGPLFINTTPPSSPFTTNGESTLVGYYLPAQPTAAVTVHLSVSNPLEGILSQATLVFTPANWNIPQYVRVTGEIGNTNGKHPYYLITSPSTSADPRYNGVTAQSVLLINVDTCPSA
jgi:hypothetical protein